MGKSYKKNWIFKDNMRDNDIRRRSNSSKRRSKFKALDFEDTPKFISKRMSSVYGENNWDFSDYSFHAKYKNESIEFMVLKSIWNYYYFGDNLRKEMEQEEREYRKNKKRYLYEKYYWAYKK